MGVETGIAARVLAAYGGQSHWRAAKQITTRVSAKGAAFRMKWQAPMVGREAVIDAHAPLVKFLPKPGDEVVEVFAGDEVRLERLDGTVIEARSNPRRYFPGGRQLLWWDRLDQTYFAGYALWNYVTFPALLIRDDIEWTEVAVDALQATFPANFPTHSAQQTFHVDPESNLVRQHDYTAAVFGGWAKAAHRVLRHEEVDGVPVGVRRRVTPRRGNGQPLPFPVLVDIEFEGTEFLA